MRWSRLGCVSFLLLSAPAWAQEPLGADDAERLGRAAEALRRFGDSACATTSACRSWQSETSFDLGALAATLERARSAALESDRLAARSRALEADVRRLEGQQAQLRAANLETALEVLRERNFGFPGRGAAGAIGAQLADPRNRESVGAQNRILTLFGYFDYPREVSLKEGPQFLKLRFEPLPFLGSGPLALALQRHLQQAGIRIAPALRTPDDSLEVEPAQAPVLDLDRPAQKFWDWTMRQRFWSSITKSEAQIDVDVFSASGDRVPTVHLPVSVVGRPWWTPFVWLWEKVVVQLWPSLPFLAAFAWVWRQRGRKGALDWLRQGLERQVEKAEAPPQA